MAVATLRVYGELNGFLPPEHRQQTFEMSFVPVAPVRHLIEITGVPHTEVALVLCDGEPAGLERQLSGGERLSVYPQFSNLELEAGSAIQIAPEGEPRFFADAHLGKLAGYLRLLGFDTRYLNQVDDSELVAMAVREGRIVLSRDRLLLMRKGVSHGAYLYEQDPKASLEYLIRRYRLCERSRPFSRCMSCNGLLQAVEKDGVIDLVPAGVFEIQEDFWRCRGCGQIYWQGTHWRVLRDVVNAVCADA